MGCTNWTEINIQNITSKTLSFRKAQHEWGKFDSSEKEIEIYPQDLDKKKIAPNKEYKIGACGRENTWSGCDGNFELRDDAANVVVAKIKFYSPHSLFYNQFSIDCPTQDWTASQTGAYLSNDQALEAIAVAVSNV
ncbi:aegerolysin Aa-Pri1 [Fusarium austroafricanum]|uniref:Aegerolysin Aa-Pri1 n=1 Tax=Fusarium austroafricanum TaxID=2364996 RepID=A0A8H4NTC5_9HYPO|nr:aegerolysin Aa-Pri1 [Fusarium austroafricanum]